MTDRPDILFILSDQHTRKIARCYGDPVAQTPNIDRIAARGVAFDRAYCPSPICTPSRMSLLSGRWPHENRCWTLEDQLSSDIPTYAHALGAAGYRTILCGRMHSIGPDQLHGFSERHVGDCSPNWLGAPRQDLGELSGAQGPAAPSTRGNDRTAFGIRQSGIGQSGYEVVDDAATDAACQCLESLGRARAAGDRTPFLLQVGYILPHCPFVARRPDYEAFAGRVGADTLPRSQGEHPFVTGWRRYSRTDAPDREAAVRARTAYYGLVRALDSKIGRVLDALHNAALHKNILIVYASDHGEQLGDRDLWWKNTFYEESVGVPLILSWRGRLREGSRCAHIVNLLDIGTTFIQAAGAPALPRARGRCLLQTAAEPATPPTGRTFSEYVTDRSSAWTGPEPTCQRMVRHGRWKFVYVHGDRPQLFDLHDDPHELRDLGEDPAYADVRRQLEELVLDGWDPVQVAGEVEARTAEKALFRDWGRATAPDSRFQFRIGPHDSWLDPAD